MTSPEKFTKRPRLHRSLKALGITFLVLLLAVAGITAWALNRYVIDHVEIDDVAAFEAEVLAERPPTVEPTSPPEGLSEKPAVDDVAPSAAEPAAPEPEAEPEHEAPPGLDDVSPVFSSVDPTYSYADETTRLAITEVVTGSGDDRLTYFVADIVITDATQIFGGFANNQFGRNIIANTSDIANDYAAIFAINGDYFGFRGDGITIRNGVLFRDNPARIGMVSYSDGRVEIYDETETTGQQLLDDGAWNTFSFGPGLLVDGVIQDAIEDLEVDETFGRFSIQGPNPRTGIGIVDKNHWVFIVVDGRSAGYSRGATMTEFAEIFQSLGVTTAYNLDGGGSATMVFDGQLVNNPRGNGKERGTSDILYLMPEAP